MTTDLLFAPALPRKLPSSFQCDRAETPSASHASKTDKPGLSEGKDPESFLSTLKKVTQHQNSNRDLKQQKSGCEACVTRNGLPSKNELLTDQHASGEEMLMELMALLQSDESLSADQSPVSAELSELISLLEAMGWIGDSAERAALSGGAVNTDNLLLPEGNPHVMPSLGNTGNGIPVDPEQLRQILVEKMPTDLTGINVDEAAGGQNRNQSQVFVELIRWAKGVIQEQNQTGLATTAAADESSGTGKPLASAMAGSDGKLPHFHGLENAGRSDARKSHPEIQVSAEAEGPVRNMKNPGHNQGNGPANIAANEIAAKVAGGTEKTAGNRAMMSAPGHQNSGAEPLKENATRGDLPPVSRSADETAPTRDNSLKADAVLNGDAGTKVVKSEGGTNDGGQWTSQTHSSEKTVETASSSRDAQGTPRELQTHTMEQIVRRAVFQIRDGQQEARIELKPEFLGHVRMQVITENQQVTVKILTEFGFVKDMLENNIQQLKADLQQQGLEVDKVDVSVSRDSNGKNHQQEDMAHAKNQSSEKHDRNEDENDSKGQRDTADRPPGKADGPSTVDYFA